ncbi:MAG: DNA-deoxyinosine glycosylase [Oscillospiraceae bacterium]
MGSSIQKHNISPLYNSNSQVLILGSFPSVKSREQSFFYGHPQNRFWLTLANLLKCDVPSSIEQKKSMLLDHNIALWDVIKCCEISGSSDSSIKNVEPNDLTIILSQCNIKKIFANGKASQTLFNKYIKPELKREIILLPSTSPANAAYSVERLIVEWGKILD